MLCHGSQCSYGSLGIRNPVISSFCIAMQSNNCFLSCAYHYVECDQSKGMPNFNWTEFGRMLMP